MIITIYLNCAPLIKKENIVERKWPAGGKLLCEMK